MRFSKQILGISMTLLLAACGGGQVSQNAVTPQFKAQVTTVNGVSSFSGNRANYTITKTSTGYTVKDNVGQDGVTNLIAPSRLMFADVGVAFDLTGTAGKAYRIYQAAFNRTPDQAGLGFWVYAMDQGATLSSVASGFMNSDEFKTKYGANLDNAAFVSALYANVLHRPLDQGGYDFWVNGLNNKAASAADVMASFSESDENKAQVAAATANGISFTPYLPPPPPMGMAKLAACPDATVTNQPQFYQCMIGTMSGHTTFGNAPCTLTINSNGAITLATAENALTLRQPYYGISYMKMTLGKSFTMSVNVGGLFENGTVAHTFRISSLSSSGTEASIGPIACKFLG